VLGAGPAGLTAGYVLAQRARAVVVCEAGDQVGGLARTVERGGYHFDLGGHRFFTKSDEVQRLWRQVLGDELLVRARLSRIHWRGRFIDYPLQLTDVVRKLGPLELARCSSSYAVALAGRRGRDHETFEDWVCARFGRRLFELFFRFYPEKVWGVPTSEIHAAWAAQRIRTLSFARVVRAALRDGADVHEVISRHFFGHDQLVGLRLASGQRICALRLGYPPWHPGDRVQVWIEGPVEILPRENGGATRAAATARAA
jgi:protoporphyrinogen oxidase